MQFWTNSTATLRLAIIIAVAALAGCESKISVELATEAPADLEISQVNVLLRGVEFQKDSGGTDSLEFDSSEPVNLMNLLDSNFLRLFTDEELGDGRYTGVRLLFDDEEDDDRDNQLILTSGEEIDLTFGTTDEFSEVDFTVDKDDSSSDSIVLTLDLRQSLPLLDNDTETTVLTPVLRAIREEDAGGIAGNVSVSCPANSSLAIYLFLGEDITPDDRDGAGVEPYLTTGVGVNGSSTTSGYAFSFLPEGGYTLASTCRGDEEDPGVSDDLDFRNVINVDVEAESTTTQNIPN